MNLIIIILSCTPLIIWSFIEPFSFRFYDLASTFSSIGQILGLLGMTLFSINLILSGRFKFLDKYFNGLDKVYMNHSKIGALSFSLILFHPLFLVFKYLIISTEQAALFFVPFINTPITWGILSLVLMIILISFTFYIKLKYNVWKISHKFMTLAFVFGIFHTFSISSDVSRNNLLRYYILLLALTGLSVSIWQSFLKKFLVKKNYYKIKNVNSFYGNLIEIDMEPIKDKIVFEPGQFAFFSFISSGVSSESHPFSFSSSCLENDLKIIVKNLGDFTSSLQNLKVGDGVNVDGPYGRFSYKNSKNKNQIWIAGGIGITPFLSMVQTLENEYNVDLYYSVKEDKEAMWLNNLEEISQRNQNFKYHIWNAFDKGYINAKMISDLSNGLVDKDIFLCGPPMFMESLKNQFITLGVDIKKIHYENFNF